MIRLQGVEQPQAKTGSFVLDISSAQPGVGEATEILVGAKLYIHYPILDTLHAKNPKVKSWIVVDTNSSLGVDPSSLTVAIRNVELLRQNAVSVAVSKGLESGDIVVTAGVQALHPGQKVRLLGSPK